MLIIRRESLPPIYDDVYRQRLSAAYNYHDNACRLRSIKGKFWRTTVISGRKLHPLPLKRKIELIDAVEKRPAGKQKEVAEEFGIIPNTLSTIVKDKDKYQQALTFV